MTKWISISKLDNIENNFHLLSIPFWSHSHPDGCKGLLEATCFLLLPSAKGPTPSNGTPELRQVRASLSSYPGIVLSAGFLLMTLQPTICTAGDKQLGSALGLTCSQP